MRVDAPPDVTDGGLKFQLDPGGMPLALKLTVCADPLVVVVLIVNVVELPCVTVWLAVAEIEKSDTTLPSAATGASIRSLSILNVTPPQVSLWPP